MDKEAKLPTLNVGTPVIVRGVSQKHANRFWVGTVTTTVTYEEGQTPGLMKVCGKAVTYEGNRLGHCEEPAHEKTFIAPMFDVVAEQAVAESVYGLVASSFKKDATPLDALRDRLQAIIGDRRATKRTQRAGQHALASAINA